MKIIGHRGAKNLEPENTLRSIEKALDLGVSMIEVDVLVCASGEVVVFHDETVDRTTNGTGFIKDTTLAELKKLDAGKGERIPTLQEAIEFIDQRVPLIIEFKTSSVAKAMADTSDAVQPVLTILQQYLERGWDASAFFVASFNHYDLLKCKEQIPQIGRLPIFEGIPLGYTQFVRSLNPVAITLYYETINQAFVDDAHANGIEVFAYTINDMHFLERMKQLGVDAVATDRPDEIQD